MADLADRIEAATEGSRELDRAIATALLGRPYISFQDAPIPHYTSSVDAALSLYLRVPDRVPSNPRLAAAEALRQREETGQ